MLYASLKAVHLLAIIVWVGGMFFMIHCLRPAASMLEPPLRLALLHATMRRFFAVVIGAIIVILASGAAMIAMAWAASRRANLLFNMPLDWYTMIALFIVMVAVFVHIRWVLFRRLEAAVAAQTWPAGAAAAGAIRWEVMLNLVLGIFIVVAVRLGGAA
ncbi:MAG TPA: CopD family protein [Caldimonas sp.]|nr:CopD family protein [Caldimonas sp.]HEX2540504.1 CopD family protein [Caldimonas sp.]